MPTYNVDAETEILVTPLAVARGVFRRVATSAIGVAVECSETLANIESGDAENDATFTVTATSNVGKAKSASSAIGVAVTASGIKAKNTAASNAIAFAVTAIGIIGRPADAESEIAVGVSATRAPSILHKFCETELQIYQGAYVELEQGTVGFFFPYGGPTSQLVFKKPLFGDQREQFDQVEVRHSRSGERYSYAKNPTYTRLNFTFVEVGQTLAEDFLEFCRLSKAQEVRLVDWYQRVWRGIIINEPRVIQTIAKNNCSEVFTLTVQFEGELVE